MNKKDQLRPTKIIVKRKLDLSTLASDSPFCSLPASYFEPKGSPDDDLEESERAGGDQDSQRTLLCVSTWDGRDILSIHGKNSTYKNQ